MRTKRVLTHSSGIPETAPDTPQRCANPDCQVEFVPLRPWHRYHTPACRARDWNRSKKAASQPTTTRKAAISARRYIIHCLVEFK